MLREAAERVRPRLSWGRVAGIVASLTFQGRPRT
jgi:hypothetical protein